MISSSIMSHVSFFSSSLASFLSPASSSESQPSMASKTSESSPYSSSIASLSYSAFANLSHSLKIKKRLLLILSSLGRFALDREFVNMEELLVKHVRTFLSKPGVSRIPMRTVCECFSESRLLWKRFKNSHLGCLLKRLGCLLGYLDMLLADFQHQDRPKMAPSRATLTAQNNNLWQLKWPKVWQSCSKTNLRAIIFWQNSA